MTTLCFDEHSIRNTRVLRQNTKRNSAFKTRVIRQQHKQAETLIAIFLNEDFLHVNSVVQQKMCRRDLSIAFAVTGTLSVLLVGIVVCVSHVGPAATNQG